MEFRSKYWYILQIIEDDLSTDVHSAYRMQITMKVASHMCNNSLYPTPSLILWAKHILDSIWLEGILLTIRCI